MHGHFAWWWRCADGLKVFVDELELAVPWFGGIVATWSPVAARVNENVAALACGDVHNLADMRGDAGDR